MKINPQHSRYSYTDSEKNTSFGSAKDINLKYIYKNRLHLLPDRMKNIITQIVRGNIECSCSLRDLHISVYKRLLDCKTLDEARNVFPEFREVLDLSNVVQRDSANLRKIKEKKSVSEFSLFMLKERWGKLRTLNEIALNLGLKDRSALSWFADKVRIPDLGKNYQTLLKASDEELNAQIASKTKAYNRLHYESVVRRNRDLSRQNKALNSFISKEAWRRLPEVRDALSEVSSRTRGEERFGVFWQLNPKYARMYGEMKHQIAEEIKQSKK